MATLLVLAAPALVDPKTDAWPHLRPTVPTFDTYGGIEPFEAWMRRETPPPTRAAHVSPGGFLACEHLFAMAAAVRLHEEIGRARVEARIHELNGAMREELARMPHVAVDYGPGRLRPPKMAGELLRILGLHRKAPVRVEVEGLGQIANREGEAASRLTRINTSPTNTSLRGTR